MDYTIKLALMSPDILLNKRMFVGNEHAQIDTGFVM